MAGYALIDIYLEKVRAGLAHRVDVAEVVAELADHLYSAVEHAEAGGSEVRAAQEATLARFGDPRTVATALATNDRGGIAVPTSFTRSAGTVALVGAGLWLAVPVMWLVAHVADDRRDDDWEVVSQVPYFVGATALLGALATTLIVMAALLQRHGGLGLLAWIGLSLTGLGTAAAGFVAWFVPGWGTLVALGTLCFAAAMLPAGVAPRLPTIALGGAWTVGAAAWIVLRALEVGPADEWGDYWVAHWVGVSVGAVIIAAGLTGLGRWLASEVLADHPPAQPIAAA